MGLKDDTFKDLKKIIENSDLSETDQKDWLNYIKRVEPRYVFVILALFKENPKLINWINENVKMKRKIIKEKNQSEWHKLLKNEREYLTNLSEK